MAHFLIEKLFKYRGIEDFNSLSLAEKQDYDRWQKILTEGEITVNKIKEFCSQQISIIHAKFKEDNTNERNNKLIAMHNVYKSILDIIEKPKVEREQLEKFLHDLLEK